MLTREVLTYDPDIACLQVKTRYQSWHLYVETDQITSRKSTA